MRKQKDSLCDMDNEAIKKLNEDIMKLNNDNDTSEDEEIKKE